VGDSPSGDPVKAGTDRRGGCSQTRRKRQGLVIQLSGGATSPVLAAPAQAKLASTAMAATEVAKRRRPPRELKPSLADAVTQALRSDIIRGRWEPRERLFEVRLAEVYGVSRVPIRESLRRLESEGFIVVVPNRGATVNALTAREVAELLSVRACLEREAAREAAANRTQKDLLDLHALVKASRPLLEASNFDGLARLNTEFHQALFAASGNHTAMSLVAPLWSKITWSYSVNAGSSRLSQSWEEHRRLVGHIEVRDSQAAADELDRHLQGAARDRQFRFAAGVE
jgi:DNA-binding GntR family transcriptional regulator